ncbi:hypothetical protein BDFB_014233 [Asbolus verrucosus]|uniref:Uncharacterized protein n=1 Tax=Asbolus verrucosus TaxID=1661398 RepID=A0A482VCA3_ASBVE|nr:hypothetical protein BDFB_014233 [Asbolus verrucosus]
MKKYLKIPWSYMKHGFTKQDRKIMDGSAKNNASYHPMKDITEWPVKNIYFEPRSLKQEHAARANKQDNQYVINEMAEQAGNEVLVYPRTIANLIQLN